MVTNNMESKMIKELTGSSASKNSRINVERVDTVPRNILTELRTTRAVLGTLKIREKGYIIGTMAQL